MTNEQGQVVAEQSQDANFDVRLADKVFKLSSSVDAESLQVRVVASKGDVILASYQGTLSDPSAKPLEKKSGALWKYAAALILLIVIICLFAIKIRHGKM